ncbi:hypothetical protein [Candidatus Poriferisodalis sp.]|uniref:hypothetical protein n=1 Tax=Candidatus Poriferisodalis sp. TaxID=3101277 RepID=UPI003AF8FC4C
MVVGTALVVGTISTASEVSVSTCSLDGVAASVVGAGWGTVVAEGRFDRFLRILSPAALACDHWHSRSGVASMFR